MFAADVFLPEVYCGLLCIIANNVLMACYGMQEGLILLTCLR